MNVKNVKLTKAASVLKGMPVPEQKNGNIGNITQDIIDDLGYKTNHSTGPDIPSINGEIKTKGIESTSAYGIGSMTLDDIKNNDYEHSSIKGKLQTQFHVVHSQTFREIVKADTLDFTKPAIQEKLRYAYESAREKILKGSKENYIRGEGACGYFERKKRPGGKLTNSWSFRIPVQEMEILKGMARSKFESLFDII